MDDKKDGDLFETNDDQDIRENEEDVIKSVRKRRGRHSPDWLENEQRSKKDRLRRMARRQKQRRFPDKGL